MSHSKCGDVLFHGYLNSPGNIFTGIHLYLSLILLIELTWGIYSWKRVGRMCGFLLTEEGKKQKKFFSHMAGSMGLSVWGSSGHVAFRVQLFLLPSAIG